MVLQFRQSFLEIICPRADSPESKALAIWDGVCTVSWVAASQRKILMDVCGFTVQIHVEACTVDDDLEKEMHSLDHSDVNLIVGWNS